MGIDMTVIANFVLGNVPVVLADMLTTGVARPSLTLPTSGPVTNLPPSVVKPTELLQKLVVVAPHFAVAFAGAVDRGRRIIHALRLLAKEGLITPAVWQKFLVDKEPMLTHVSLVGILMEKKSDGTYDVHQLGYRAKAFEHPVLGNAVVAGTGQQHLLLAADCAAQYPHLSPLERAIASVLTMFSYLLREEHATGSPITVGEAGGAYELAIFDGIRFVKISDITYIAWRIDVVGNTVSIIAPYLVMKQVYIGDVAVINCARWDGASALHVGDAPKYELAAHAILPPYQLDRAVQLPTADNIGFESRITVHCMLVANGEDSHILHVVTMGVAGFSMSKAGDGYEMAMPAELISEIRSAVLSNLVAPRA